MLSLLAYNKNMLDNIPMRLRGFLLIYLQLMHFSILHPYRTSFGSCVPASSQQASSSQPAEGGRGDTVSNPAFAQVSRRHLRKSVLYSICLTTWDRATFSHTTWMCASGHATSCGTAP